MALTINFIKLCCVFICIAGGVSAIGFDARSYVVAFDIVDDQLAIRNVTMLNGPSGFNPAHNEGDYEVRLLADNRLLLSARTEMMNRLNVAPTPDMFDAQGNQVKIDSGSSINLAPSLAIPYYSEATTLELYDGAGRLLDVFDVSQYRRCNLNGVCEDNLRESSTLCPEDCGATLTNWTTLGVVLGVVVVVLLAIPLFRK